MHDIALFKKQRHCYSIAHAGLTLVPTCASNLDMLSKSADVATTLTNDDGRNDGGDARSPCFWERDLNQTATITQSVNGVLVKLPGEVLAI